ncbi:hypothetical protein PGB90_003075 [Kerria lacca]
MCGINIEKVLTKELKKTVLEQEIRVRKISLSLRQVMKISTRLLGRAKSDTQNVAENEVSEILDKYRKEYSLYTGLSYINTLALVPEDTRESKPEDVKFIFYNAPEYGGRIEGDLNEQDFPVSPVVFNSSYDTKIFIHDWLQEDEPLWAEKTAFNYAIKGNKVNFMFVDWSNYTHIPYSILIQSKIQKVAEYVNQMIHRLILKGANPKTIHIIGLGTGAHIGGLAAKNLSPKIGRITGLSPFGPTWNEKPETERLSKGDADFVDIIHTNMGLFGFSKTMGDVDFLPNGGNMQTSMKNKYPLMKNIMSHLMAKTLYDDSINFGLSYIGKNGISYHDFLGKKNIFNMPIVMGEYVTKK